MTNQYLQVRLYRMKQDKTNPKYIKNPAGHLQALYAFRDRLEVRVLGEEDVEWRGELEFVLDRTKDKIREIQAKVI